LWVHDEEATVTDVPRVATVRFEHRADDERHDLSRGESFAGECDRFRCACGRTGTRIRTRSGAARPSW
jgi:hypothetical protein